MAIKWIGIYSYQVVKLIMAIYRTLTLTFYDNSYRNDSTKLCSSALHVNAVATHSIYERSIENL